MTNGEQDLRFAKEAVPQLQEFLLSSELYWPLSGPLPRLTPGSLLLALLRLSVSSPVEAQKLEIQVDAVRVKWRTAWEKKVLREVSNRFRLWSQYLSDYLAAPDQNLDSYRTEVRGRVILQLLMNADLPEFPERPALANLDDMVRSRLRPGGFLWEPELQPVFPKKDFWFLYGNL